MTEEGRVQKAILDYLEYRGILHARTNAGRVGGVRLCPKGWPDVVCCFRGLFVAIEVKAADGTLSADQIATLLKVRDDGGIAVAARTVEDVARVLV